MGKVMGVLPRMLKSKALCVYFQMYSPLTTTFLPKACCRLAWNSLRKPGLSVPDTPGVQRSRGARTVFEHPLLDSTRFSLNGVSRVRAYETLSTVLVGWMWYPIPTRGSACRADVRPL